MATAFALDHIVLRCTDQEATLAWYIKHAGLASVNVEAWRAGNAFFPSLRVNEDTIIDYIAGLDPGGAARQSRSHLLRREPPRSSRR